MRRLCRASGFFGLLRTFVWLRSLPNVRGGENGRLLFASRRFFADGTLLRKNCRTVRPASARQSVRRCGTCRLTASRCTVEKESRLNGRIHFAAANRTCPSRGRLTGIPPVFLMETAETSCRSLRVAAVVPMPGRGIPAVFNYTHRRGVGLPPAELLKAEKTRIRRIICTMRRLVSAKRTVKPKRQAAERGGAGAFAFTVPLRRVRIAVAASGCVEEKSLTEFLPPIGWRGMPQRIGCAISVRPPPRSSLSRFVSQSARRAGLARVTAAVLVSAIGRRLPATERKTNEKPAD